MLARLKLLVFLLPILIYFSGCGFSGNESDFGSSSSSSTTGDDTTDTDTTVPTNPSISINNGTSTTTSSSVTLRLSASDNVGVTGYYLSSSSSTPSSTASGWTSVTSNTAYSADNVSYTLTGGAGTNTVYVWFKDATGNVSSSASDSITLDDLTLTLITSWGSLGTSSGQFSNPQYTQVYGSKIYVSDNQLNSLNNKKVAVYDLSGNLENEIIFSNTVSDLCIYNSRLYVVSGGDVVNLNISNTSENYTINLQDSSGSSITGNHCTVNSNNIFILSDSTFKVYKFSLSNFQSTTTDNATTSWGSGGTGSGQYMGTGSIINDENYVYISSRDGSGITKFDTSGNVIKHSGTPKIRQICFNPDNSSEIFGTDNSNGKFTIFNKDLTILKTASYSGGDSGLSSDSSGYVYISGYHNDYKISKYLLTRN